MRIAAENGATAHELMAIFGWLALKEAERYTRAAERKKLAERGMARLIPIKTGTQSTSRRCVSNLFDCARDFRIVAPRRSSELLAPLFLAHCNQGKISLPLFALLA